MLCPSDGFAGQSNINSDRASLGSSPIRYSPSIGVNGVFSVAPTPTGDTIPRAPSYKLSNITDGTSNTIAFGEVLVGDGQNRLYRGNGMTTEDGTGQPQQPDQRLRRPRHGDDGAGVVQRLLEGGGHPEQRRQPERGGPEELPRPARARRAGQHADEHDRAAELDPVSLGPVRGFTCIGCSPEGSNFANAGQQPPRRREFLDGRRQRPLHQSRSRRYVVRSARGAAARSSAPYNADPRPTGSRPSHEDHGRGGFHPPRPLASPQRLARDGIRRRRARRRPCARRAGPSRSPRRARPRPRPAGRRGRVATAAEIGRWLLLRGNARAPTSSARDRRLTLAEEPADRAGDEPPAGSSPEGHRQAAGQPRGGEHGRVGEQRHEQVVLLVVLIGEEHRDHPPGRPSARQEPRTKPASPAEPAALLAPPAHQPAGHPERQPEHAAQRRVACRSARRSARPIPSLPRSGRRRANPS